MLHRVQLHKAGAAGDKVVQQPVSFDAIRHVREQLLSKTTLNDALKPAVRSVAFIFDDTPFADALHFIATQNVISVR